MFMVHHDNRDYAVAASAAARSMREKLQRRIEAGRANGAAAIERIMTEVPNDKLVPGAAIAFEPGDDGFKVHYGDVVENLHAFALGQFAEHARIPRPYLTHLVAQGAWGPALAAESLTRIFAHDGERHLIRTVHGQTRARLSTKYRRLHPGVLLEAFQRACDGVRAVPYEATATDTKFMVRAVVEDVIEPVRDEVLALGVVLHESPFGNGATEVSPFIERMFCTNLAVCSTELRRVHLGGRLDASIEWSDATIVADTRVMGLQIGDLVRTQLGGDAVRRIEATVRAAHEEKVDAGAFEGYLRKHLTRDEAEGVVGAFASADIENLPPGPSVWRASNALSWFAHGVTDPERRFEIAKLAGAVLRTAA